MRAGDRRRTPAGRRRAAPVAVRRRAGTLVGRAVASVANLLDLRLAVVAGSVALGYGADFFAAAQAEADARARLSFSRGVRIVPPARPADAALLGAAAVGWRRPSAAGDRRSAVWRSAVRVVRRSRQSRRLGGPGHGVRDSPL